MNSLHRQKHGSTRRSRFSRRVIFSLATGAMILPFRAEGSDTTKPAVNPFPPKAVVKDSDPELVFVRAEIPLKIRKDGIGPVKLTVDFTKGRSAVDTEDPTKIVVYPFPILWTIPNPKPIPAMPKLVWEVYSRGGKIYATIRFGRWSDTFEEACKQHWITKNREFLDRERQTRNMPGLEVVVKRPPVIELFVAIQDRVTGLTLAHNQQHVLRGPDELDFTFEFEPDQFEAFLAASRDGKVAFQPIWRATTRNIGLGVQRVSAKVEIRKAIEDKIRSEGLQLDGPIDQMTYAKMSREIQAEISGVIAVDGSEALPLLKPNLLILEGILRPDGWMNWEDFRRARGSEADRVLAEYLAPHQLIKTTTTVKNESESSTKGTETTQRSGGPVISYPGFTWNVSDENTNRDIDLVTKASGVEFREGETKNTFLPHKIKVYRLNQVGETLGTNQVFVVQLGGQLGTHYLKDQPISQEINSELVESSLSHTIANATNLTDLLKKRAKIQADLEAETTHIEEKRAEGLASTKMIGSETTNLIKFLSEVAEHRLHEGRYGGMVEWIIHQRAMWCMEPKDGGSQPYWTGRRETEKALALSASAAVTKTTATIAGAMSNLEATLEITVGADEPGKHKHTIKTCNDRLQQLHRELADLDRRILAVARR